MTHIATFDIETAGLPETRDAAVDILCAAIHTDWPGMKPTTFFHEGPFIKDFAPMRRTFMDLQANDVKIFTWNGAGFDFRALYNATGDSFWAQLALAHYDPMLQVVHKLGHTLKLDKALLGAGLATKQHSVVLSTGEEIHDMSGARVQELWGKGEYDAVLFYLNGDVVQLAELLAAIAVQRAINWTSDSGRANSLAIPELYRVRDLLAAPRTKHPAWKTKSKFVDEFVDWAKDK